MQCTVLLFAMIADEIGSDRLEVHLPPGSTAGDVLDQLARDHAIIAAMRDQLAVAVNEQYAALDEVLTPGCECALIPPVSGG